MIALLCTMLDLTSPAAMASIYEDRLSRLDRLSICVTHSLYFVHSETDLLSRSAWQRYSPPSEFEHQLLIVRPILRDEWLTDLPADGYEPVTSSVSEAGYAGVQTLRSGRSAGKLLYNIVPDHVQSGVFRWAPLLQAFEIHLQDSSVELMTIAGVLRHDSAQATGRAEGLNSYTASLPMSGLRMDCALDMTDAGLPRRLRTSSVFDNRANQPAFWEQHVLQTTTVNGTELPVESIVAVHNPNVSDRFAVHHFLVTSFAQNPALKAEALIVRPTCANSVVNEYIATGGKWHRVYGPDGSMVSEDFFEGGPSPIVTAAHDKLPDHRGRFLIPPLAVTLGGACAFIHWKRGRRGRA